ncbi:MAG TPA: heme-binding protein [Vicinamibacterales bacterium]|nr:heme-binding protein [Vicinamibacterales bacterium]
MANTLFRLGVILMALTVTGAAEQLPTKRVLTLDAARRMAVAAEAEAVKNGWLVSVAVVDDGGNLLLFHRMDNSKLVAIDIAIRKAKTAVFFQGETKALELEVTKGGRTSLLPIDDFMPLEGGLPIAVEGKIIGAIGVSGMAGDQDAQCAAAGLKALGAK